MEEIRFQQPDLSKSSANKAKIKYLMDKVLQCKNVDFSEEFFFLGTQNQVKWVKNKLEEKLKGQESILIENR